MSTRSTYLLTIENEHWYYEDCDRSIVLEIDPNHRWSYNSEDGHIFIIKKGTPLYDALRKSFEGINPEVIIEHKKINKALK